MVTAATVQVKFGGEFSNGPAKGQYHVIVSDAQIGAAKSSGRPNITLDIFVKNDPGHPNKEGKRLQKLFQSLPMESDDADKRKSMRGMVKRLCYDGFGVEYPTEEKDLDPRVWIGKTAWVLVGDQKDQSGQLRTGIVAVAQKQEQLPLPKGATSTIPPKNGGRRR